MQASERDAQEVEQRRRALKRFDDYIQANEPDPQEKARLMELDKKRSRELGQIFREFPGLPGDENRSPIENLKGLYADCAGDKSSVEYIHEMRHGTESTDD